MCISLISQGDSPDWCDSNKRDSISQSVFCGGTNPLEMLFVYKHSLIFTLRGWHRYCPVFSIHDTLSHISRSEKLCVAKKKHIKFYPVFLKFLILICQSICWSTSMPTKETAFWKCIWMGKAWPWIVSLPLILGKLLIFWDLVSSSMISR